MRKPAFCIFYGLCMNSDITFFIGHYCAGVSNKHCLLLFFSSYFGLNNILFVNEQSKYIYNFI